MGYASSWRIPDFLEEQLYNHSASCPAVCSGLQISVVSLAGPPVTLAARDNWLAVVWNGSPSPVPGDYSLRFAIYDVNFRVQLQEGHLPLSPASTLVWLGFTESGLLAAFDSEVRVVGLALSTTTHFRAESDAHVRRAS